MLKRRQINADQGRSAAGRAADSGRRAVRSTWWAIEERAWQAGAPLRRLRQRRASARAAAPAPRRSSRPRRSSSFSVKWTENLDDTRFGAALARAAEVVRWPFERVAWAFERRVLWPVQERFAGRVPSGAGWTLGAGAVAAVGVAIVAVAAIAISDGSEPEVRTATAEPVTIASAPAPAEPVALEASAPVLQGAQPNFEVGGASVADPADPDAPVSSTATGDDPSGASATSAAASSSAKAVPAGPVAMKVARRFSEAFVKYEVGSNEERATEVFAETATPALASALAERPPRQPSRLEVPRAKVLNLVPGPRRGKTYTVSASLLRVGTTSELRLEMRKQSGNWLVTDVRG